MSTLKLFAAAILAASVVATPVLAQAVISEPGYWSDFNWNRKQVSVIGYR